METLTNNPKPESISRKLINMFRKLFRMEALANNPKPESMPKKLFEDAVDDAQYLVAYAASKCRGKIDDKTIKTLVNAKRLVDDKQQTVSADFEAEFWLAYQHIWELVRPVTAESIKATDRQSRSTVKGYIVFAFSFLILLLILQIYWVIGNQLNTQLDDLLTRQTELSQKISQNNDEFKAIEIRFKQADVDSGNFEAHGNEYTYSSSINWERDTLANLSARNQLESDIASLNAQLERSSAILLTWSSPWKWLITEGDDRYTADIRKISGEIQIQEKKLADDPDGSKAAPKEIAIINSQIRQLKTTLSILEKDAEATADQINQVKSEIDYLIYLSQPDVMANQISDQANQYLDQLKYQLASLEGQQKGDASRQALLATQFVLVILASYLLPLVYGILGAATSVLRSLSKKIENVTFSGDTGIQNLLRISLGALAGIVVGWFSFLLPNNEAGSFLGTVSPLAVAFLVGYNIELFFSLMDAVINRVKELQKPSSPPKDDDQTPDSHSTANQSTA